MTFTRILAEDFLSGIPVHVIITIVIVQMLCSISILHMLLPSPPTPMVAGLAVSKEREAVAKNLVRKSYIGDYRCIAGMFYNNHA